jgi:hypothetical protein
MVNSHPQTFSRLLGIVGFDQVTTRQREPAHGA